MSSLARSIASKTLVPAITSIFKKNFHASCVALRAQVQKPAPPFQGTAVINSEFKDIKLSDYAGKYVILMFYPLDFTFVCPTEIISFSDKSKDFEAIDCHVIACSTDSHFSHLAWTNLSRKEGGLGPMNIALLSDYKKEIAADYDVLLEGGFALRGLFIIDRNGILRHITVNDLPVGRNVEEYLRLVKGFQFSDQHGEVCPANWNPDTNKDTIKPDPKGSKEYFKKTE